MDHCSSAHTMSYDPLDSFLFLLKSYKILLQPFTDALYWQSKMPYFSQISYIFTPKQIKKACHVLSKSFGGYS